MAKAKKKSQPDVHPSNLLKKLLSLPLMLSVLSIILCILSYEIMLTDKYYPLTFVGDTNLSFLTEGQAIRTLQAKFDRRSQQKLSFFSGPHNFTVDIATSSAKIDYSDLDTPLNTHRRNWWTRLTAQLQSLTTVSKIYPKVSLSLDKQLETIDSVVKQLPKNAQLIFDETPTPEGSPSARIQIKPAVLGFSLDKEGLKQQVINYLLTNHYQPALILQEVKPQISTNQVTLAKQALESLMTQPIKLIFENNTWTIDTKQLLTLLNLSHGEGLLLDQNQTNTYLTDIAANIDQKVQEGLFEFDPATKKVANFKPSQEGRKLNLDKTFNLLSAALTPGGNKTIMLPVDIVKPKIQTSDVNNLGIKELLGRGISNFAGSISNRIYNISLTATKINGVLIPPGETFSFNNTVGDISAATGYKQAYVIKEGRTVLDDGGGVCQDSTTLFRAALYAGLPIVERTAHAYRVGYYEQGFPPGLDATVFYPSVDFKFKNDTPSHILIQAYTSGTTLYIDLYGTDDGRQVTMTHPVISSQTPPPAELRQDDPSLPRGVVKQVDFSAWGATVAFSRTVKRGTETLIQETWKSFYKPWQAIFLVGTG